MEVALEAGAMMKKVVYKELMRKYDGAIELIEATFQLSPSSEN